MPVGNALDSNVIGFNVEAARCTYCHPAQMDTILLAGRHRGSNHVASGKAEVALLAREIGCLHGAVTR